MGEGGGGVGGRKKGKKSGEWEGERGGQGRERGERKAGEGRGEGERALQASKKANRGIPTHPAGPAEDKARWPDPLSRARRANE